MFKYLRKRKGQSTLEYAILIIIVIGALLTIQVYIKRGIQGRLKSATDDIGDQYKPGSTNWRKQSKTVSNTQETYTQGAYNTKLMADEVSSTNVYSNVIGVNEDFWGKK